MKIFDANNMKSIFRPALGALLLCLTAAPALAADQDEATLKNLEQTWITAITKTDRVALDKLLDDSFVETAPNGMRRSKSDLLLASSPPPGSTQTLIDMDVRVNGDTAIVTGINQFKRDATAQPVNYSFTDVFVRKPEGWRVMSAQMVRR
jgi:ketosteroid isomerase-like protein